MVFYVSAFVMKVSFHSILDFVFLLIFFIDYKKLQNSGANMTKLYERIKEILNNGIGICDRYYDFLAFSSSQLREHSCWMFSSMNGISADSIRKSMGDFRNIHPVAKMAARVSIIEN